jgi:hypothetical protein
MALQSTSNAPEPSSHKVISADTKSGAKNIDSVPPHSVSEVPVVGDPVAKAEARGSERDLSAGAASTPGSASGQPAEGHVSEAAVSANAPPSTPADRQGLEAGVSPARDRPSAFESLAGPGALPAASGFQAAELAPRVIAANPNLLEVGVHSGTHGWLTVRAEMDAEGGVSATLRSGSRGTVDALHHETAALSAYLTGEQIPLAGLRVHLAESVEGGGVTQPGAGNPHREAVPLGTSAPGGAIPNEFGTGASGAGGGQKERAAPSMERLSQTASLQEPLASDGAFPGFPGLSPPADWRDSGGWVNVRV